MDELKLKLYQIEAEVQYNENPNKYSKKYCLFAPDEKTATEIGKDLLLSRYQKLQKQLGATSIEVKSVKKVKPKMDRLLTGGME